MSDFTKKVSENIDKIKALDNIISNIDFKIKDETIQIDLIKKQITNYKNETKTIYTLNHEEFPESENIIRLYLPLMGDAGYVPNEEEIVKLFQGESITPPNDAFVSKNSKTYSLEAFEFKPLSENLYKGKIAFYGEAVPHFPKRK
ncbi:MAG: hypothetical protein E7J02_08790 [Staphylococcus warneri]|nr:hypothetical protein [Streptococcus mitis]MDU4503087.1 hypothetical protein [Staphylococcus warneri]